MNHKRYFFLLLTTFFFFCLGSAKALDVAVKWKEIYIPTTESSPEGLEAILVWPDDNEKHPVALLTNGSPRKAIDRANMAAIGYLPIAEEFAKRNFAVVYVLRRGYGSSGGEFAEKLNGHSVDNYRQSALAGAQDLRETIKYLDTLPQFDVSQLLVVGFSAGGFATVALTANPPKSGIVAAISLAGGNGSYADNKVYGEESLIENFGYFGSSSKIPMLWIYAENDHFFNPRLAGLFHKAFTENGGNAEFIAAEPYGNEGHFLFSVPGIPKWMPIIDDFLKNHHLQQSNTLLTIAHPHHLMEPANLSEKEKEAFANYIAAAPHKAFAFDEKTHRYGWRTGQRTPDSAKSQALDLCQKEGQYHCEIIAVDDEMTNHADSDDDDDDDDE